jgi:hypothetical protein
VGLQRNLKKLQRERRSKVSFRDVLQTAQAIALVNKLYPDDLAIYERACREYSKRFSTELCKVHELDFEFVARQLYSENLESWDLQEQMDDVLDLLGSLSDPDYDANKERALRDEDRRIIEEEQERLRNNESIHPSLDKGKEKFGEQAELPKNELPKSGGINMELIKQLQNEEQESGEF